MARESFATFIPISVESDARTRIIFDYFDLLSAIAAHAKTNGFGGRKLSRLAGWWAFEHLDDGNGFEGGYKNWTKCVFLHELRYRHANMSQICRPSQPFILCILTITITRIGSRSEWNIEPPYVPAKISPRNRIPTRKAILITVIHK